MNHYQNATDNLTLAEGTDNHVSEYEFLKAAQKHIEARLEEIKTLVKEGRATSDMMRLKELGASTSEVARYSIDAIKEKYGENNLSFALTFSSQTSVRVRNIKNIKEAA